MNTAVNARDSRTENEFQSERQALLTVELGADDTVIDADENFLKLLGYSLDELKGKRLPFESGPGEFKLTTKNGRTRWLVGELLTSKKSSGAKSLLAPFGKSSRSESI